MKKVVLISLAVVAGAAAYAWLTANTGRDIWEDVYEDFR